MKLSHLLTATITALTLSFSAFAANEADMDAKANMPQQKMNAKMQKADAAQMKDMKSAAMMKDSSSDMKDAAMKSEDMVNINTADAATIANAKLKGISMKKAEAIVSYREKHGNFQSIDDLMHVKGISKKIIAKNKDRLTTG